MRKAKKWSIGSIFCIPQIDNTFSLGQVVGQEKEALNSAVCAFFSTKFKSGAFELVAEEVISILFVTRDLLDSGRWEVVGKSRPIEMGQGEMIDRAKNQKFIGARIIGSMNVENFLNAYYGLEPWNDWHDPEYLDKFLITKAKKPPVSKLKFID